MAQVGLGMLMLYNKTVNGAEKNPQFKLLEKVNYAARTLWRWNSLSKMYKLAPGNKRHIGNTRFL